jgi:hypothetical protein
VSVSFCRSFTAISNSLSRSFSDKVFSRVKRVHFAGASMSRRADLLQLEVTVCEQVAKIGPQSGSKMSCGRVFNFPKV